MSGAWSLQPAGRLPLLGEEVGRGDGNKQARKIAKNLKTDDEFDQARCSVETQNVALCTKLGVVLK